MAYHINILYIIINLYIYDLVIKLSSRHELVFKFDMSV